jgi:hypothetical protein
MKSTVISVNLPARPPRLKSISLIILAYHTDPLPETTLKP